MGSTDARERLQALREILSKGAASTQEDLVESLERQDFEVTQSTVSRDLRRLGAIKATEGGRTTYRLPSEPPSAPYVDSLADLVLSIRHNGSMIVVLTSPGSANLVARHIDQSKRDDILGTIAGDDTIFIAPASTKGLPALIKRLQTSLAPD